MARMLDVQCQRNSADSCLRLATLLGDGRKVPRNPIGAARTLGRACDFGTQAACTSLANLVASDGETVLQQPCNQGDATSCFMLGSLSAVGQSVPRNPERAATLYQQSCTAGFLRACGMLGEAYAAGEGVPKDVAKAKQIFDRACGLGYQPACKALEPK